MWLKYCEAFVRLMQVACICDVLMVLSYGALTLHSSCWLGGSLLTCANAVHMVCVRDVHPIGFVHKLGSVCLISSFQTARM